MKLSTGRTWPAPWTFGVLILPLGMFVGFIWTALPFLMSKSGVGVEQISRMAAILQIPPMLMFLWTPVVDVRLRRRTWLVLAALSAAALVFIACPLIDASSFNVLAVLLASKRTEFVTLKTSQAKQESLVFCRSPGYHCSARLAACNPCTIRSSPLFLCQF